MKPYRALFSVLILVALLANLHSAHAQQAYISEKVVIDVHSLQNEEGLVVTSIASGTPIEVISTDGEYSQIQTADNKKGWLNTKYLSFEKPVSLEYLQLLGKYKKLSSEFDNAQNSLSKNQEMVKFAKAAEFSREELNKSKKQIQVLDKQLKSTTQQLDEANQKIAALEKSLTLKTANPKQANSATDSPVKPQATASAQPESSTEIHSLQVDQGPFKLPFLWSVVAIVFAFIMGIVAGMKWLDHKIRKRHGGVRIY